MRADARAARSIRASVALLRTWPEPLNTVVPLARPQAPIGTSDLSAAIRICRPGPWEHLVLTTGKPASKTRTLHQKDPSEGPCPPDQRRRLIPALFTRRCRETRPGPSSQRPRPAAQSGRPQGAKDSHEFGPTHLGTAPCEPEQAGRHGPFSVRSPYFAALRDRDKDPHQGPEISAGKQRFMGARAAWHLTPPPAKGWGGGVSATGPGRIRPPGSQAHRRRRGSPARPPSQPATQKS